MLYALGRSDGPLKATLLGSLIFFVTIAPLSWALNVAGAAIALVLANAANAYGFSANWLTGWYAYDEEARAWLGLTPAERVAGFVHIGTPTVPPIERDRPDVPKITTRWSPGA